MEDDLKSDLLVFVKVEFETMEEQEQDSGGAEYLENINTVKGINI